MACALSIGDTIMDERRDPCVATDIAGSLGRRSGNSSRHCTPNIALSMREIWRAIDTMAVWDACGERYGRYC